MDRSVRLQADRDSRSVRLQADRCSGDSRSVRLQADRCSGFTVIQLVLALAGLLFVSLVVPSWLAVRVNQSRMARAEGEAAAIADAIRRFEGDNGFLPLWSRALAGGPGEESDRLDLLMGSGGMPQVADAAGSAWLGVRRDVLSGQLTVNAPGYASGHEHGGRGWAGPYLSSDRPDPWGNRYLVVALRGGGPAMFVVSAGPNGIIETNPEDLSGPDGARGDDVVVQL